MCKSGNYEHKSTNLKQTVMNKCQELLSAKINKNRILTMQFVFYMVTKKWGKEWISNKAGQEFVHIPSYYVVCYCIRLMAISNSCNITNLVSK